MFEPITHSGDPKIMGVNNGFSQLEVDIENIGDKTNYSRFQSAFIQPDLDKIIDIQGKILNYNLDDLLGELYEDAKVTDIMVFSPHLFGIKYIVSEEFVDCLLDLRVPNKEYKLIPIKLKNISSTHYLLFIPWISEKEIFFSESLIYHSRDITNENKQYLNIRNYEDYSQLLKSNELFYFDKVSIPDKYKDRSIISIQGLQRVYLSDVLLNKLNENSISNLAKANAAELTFSACS